MCYNIQLTLTIGFLLLTTCQRAKGVSPTMQKIAAFIVKKRRLLLVVMLALAVVCAALMPFVGINTDMTKYLPDSSQMKIGMDRMNEAFPNVAETYTIRVMFRGLDARDKLAIREQLAEIPNVDSVAYEPDSDDYNRGDATLYKLTTQYDYKSDEEAQIERDVADRFDGYDVSVRSDDTSTPDIPPIVFILSIVLVTTILLIACPSYFEPVLFLITIGIAVLINQGTNIFLGETSDVTASISAILQLALSMDYSIILMNRYRQELQADPDRETAMTRALAAAFGSITGSSVTTIVGLLMLVFMRFKIGMDLGIVLAKGVLCSLLCVFTVLPGLILWADKLVRKTTKKPRAPKRERRSVLAALGRFSYRWRGAIAAAFVLLFAGTYILQLSTQIAYTLTDADPVAEVFPPDNPIVVLYNNADEDAVAALADRLEADPNVKSAMAYSTTLGRQYTAAQMADVVGALDASIPVSADMLGMIYYDAHSGGRAVTIPAGRFLRFVTDHVANNAAFAPYLDAGMTANLQTLQKFTDPAALTQQRTAESLADFLGMDAADAKQLLLYYYTQHGDASTGGMTLPAFSDFLVNEVLTDSTLADMVDASAREQAATLQTFTDVSAMTTPRGCDEIAQMLGMDEDTVRLLFVAYHTLNGDLLTGEWNVSMQTLVNFLAEHSALLDDAQAQQITMLSRIINGSVDGTSYSAAELADLLGMDAGQVRQLYLLYTSRHGDTSGWTLSVQQFVDFLCQEVLPDARFADQLSGVDTSQLQSARTVIDAVASGRSYTAAELANLFHGLSSQLDRGTMELLFLYYASVYSSDASWTMSMQELFDYLQNDLLTDARFASFLTDDMRAQITDAQTMLTDAVTQLRGSKYSRLVLTTTLPGESDETSAFIAQLMQDLDAVTTGDYYLIGNSAMVYEMENSFDSELLLITLLTAASIFLVVVFTFRSLVIPALLVLIVQCGVFITVTVVGLQGLEIYYLALLIVECILMGATIDYGILYTSYYREMRESMSVRDALIAAYRGSIHTVLTSGSIMVLVTAVVGKFFGNPTIEQICRTISIGAFSAIILILLFLPGMLALLDRWVLPRDLRRRLYPPKAPKAPKAPKPPKAAYRLWYAAFPRVQKASQRLPPAGGKTLQAFCFQKCSTSISSSQASPSSYCFRREGIPQVLKDGGHLRCQRVRVEVRLGQVALEVLDEPADGERRQRVGKFRAVRHGAAVGAHAPAGAGENMLADDLEDDRQRLAAQAHADERRALVYKGDERAPRALEMLHGRVGRGVGLALDLPLDLVEVKAQEVVLIFKMRVERRAADERPGAQLIDRDVVKRLLGHQRLERRHERTIGFLHAQIVLFFHDAALLYAHRIVSNKRHERNKR